MHDARVEPTRRVCAWCGVDMGPAESPDMYSFPLTHGICDRCDSILSGFRDLPLDQLLEKLTEPVLAVDGATGRVLAANSRAAAALGHRKAEITGMMSGEVTECTHAGEPGGCGRTVHCSGCTIRQLFEEVHHTGRNILDRHAYQYVVTPQGIRKRHYLISAAKREDVILLRITRQSNDEEVAGD